MRKKPVWIYLLILMLIVALPQAPIQILGEEVAYEIITKEDLHRFARLVNEGESFYGKVVRLKNDLDLEYAALTPVGYREGNDDRTLRNFCGIFDGNGHTIKNVTLSRPEGEQYGTLGIFGTLGDGAQINNLSIQGLRVTISTYNVYFGGLAGMIAGDAEISQCSVTDVMVTKQLEASAVLGGIVGRVQGSGARLHCMDCYATNLKGFEKGNWRGGLVGLVHSSSEGAVFENCYTDYGTAGNGVNAEVENCFYLLDGFDHGVSSQEFPLICNTGFRAAQLKEAAQHLGECYTQDRESANAGYPMFTWQVPFEGSVSISYVGEEIPLYFQADTLRSGKILPGDDVRIVVQQEEEMRVHAVYANGTELQRLENNSYGFSMPETDVTLTAAVLPKGSSENEILNGEMEDIQDISMFSDGNGGRNLTYISDGNHHMLCLTQAWDTQPVIQICTLQPGHRYAVTASIKQQSGGRAQLFFREEGKYEVIQELQTQPGVWNQLSGVFTAPQNMDHIGIAPVGRSTVLIDHWMVFDITACAIETSTPEQDAFGVSANLEQMHITFDTDMNPETMTTQNLVLSPPVTFKLKQGESLKEWTIEFQEQLEANTGYKIWFTERVRSAIDTPVQNPQLFFVTGDSPQKSHWTTPPEKVEPPAGILSLNYGKDNQLPITKGSYSQGTITALIRGIHNLGEKKTVWGVFALYSKETKRLEKLVSAERTLDKWEKDAVLTVGQIGTEEYQESGYHLALFLWDEKKQPMMPAVHFSSVDYDAENTLGASWRSVPIVSQELKEKGVIGGEGGQWELAVSCDPSGGPLVLCGTDVGGVFRSVDGGETWSPANNGLNARGANSFAIDPFNDNRILAVGCNNQASAANGIYLSEDRGESWTQVLSEKIIGHRDVRDQIAWDPSSYDERIGGCAVAYWSRGWELDRGKPVTQPPIHGEDETKGLFRTTDGGKTWSLVNSELSDKVVKVHPTNGTLYLAGLHGFCVSYDGGETFEETYGGTVLGMDVIKTAGYENTVWINDADGVLRSDDSGKTFRPIVSSTFPDPVNREDPYQIPRGLKVSPVNPQRMLVTVMDFVQYHNAAYVSDSGGVSWQQCSYDESLDMLPKNNRQLCFSWSPVEEEKVWSLGGDWVTLSTDGGKTFQWHHNGNTGIHFGGMVHFNLYQPELMYFGSQDFNGAVTVDGGESWEYINLSGKSFGGFVYGGYAADPLTYFGGDAEGWTEQRMLKITFDGGKTVVNTGLKTGCTYSESGYQSPTNERVLFYQQYRSDDKGVSWKTMEECNSVLTHNPYGKKELYGVRGRDIVVSYDDGLSWDSIVQVSEERIWDIAYDGIRDILYYISGTQGSGTKFCSVQSGQITDLTENIQENQYSEKKFQKVTLDPKHPNVVYIGGYAHQYKNSATVQRSCDGGASFEIVSAEDRNSVVRGSNGGYEICDIEVQPASGELWAANGCRGWSVLPPPYTEN